MPTTTRCVRNAALVGCGLVALSGCSSERRNSDAKIGEAARAAQQDVDNYAAVAGKDWGHFAPPAAPERSTTRTMGQAITPQSVMAEARDEASEAKGVAQRYFKLIDDHRFAAAWRLWDDGGQASGMSADAFAASFAKYSSYRADLGEAGRIEAGAGQRHVAIPVTVLGSLRDGGGPIALVGSVTLHKTVVDGSDEEWRVSASDLKPRPA